MQDPCSQRLSRLGCGQQQRAAPFHDSWIITGHVCQENIRSIVNLFDIGHRDGSSTQFTRINQIVSVPDVHFKLFADEKSVPIQVIDLESPAFCGHGTRGFEAHEHVALSISFAIAQSECTENCFEKEINVSFFLIEDFRPPPEIRESEIGSPKFNLKLRCCSGQFIVPPLSRRPIGLFSCLLRDKSQVRLVCIF